MYSGITRGLFPVVDVEKKPGLIEYVIELNSELIEELTPGASISVDGVCQTAVTINGNQVECHAMQETLSRTTLSNLHVGQMVSIERSLRYGDEIGGHEVAGHIIGTATVVDRNTTENNLSLTLECPPTMDALHPTQRLHHHQRLQPNHRRNKPQWPIQNPSHPRNPPTHQFRSLKNRRPRQPRTRPPHRHHRRHSKAYPER